MLYSENCRFVFILPFVDRESKLFWFIGTGKGDLSGSVLSVTFRMYDSKNLIGPCSSIGNVYLDVYCNENEAELVDIVILGSYQRKGLGSFMLRMADYVAKANGVKRIWGKLFYRDQQEKDKLVSFYTKNGYSIKRGIIEKLFS